MLYNENKVLADSIYLFYDDYDINDNNDDDDDDNDRERR